MKILLVGSGGREHALAWKIRQSPLVEKLYIAPGNGGTALLGENIDIADNDIPNLTNFAKKMKIDMVVVGPELPLVLGLKDSLERENIYCFGPGAFGARLEGSKAFAKSLMRESEVPTAGFMVFDHIEQAVAWSDSHPFPQVIKADGLAAGKGVVIAENQEEAKNALHQMMVEKIFGSAGERVVIEEALVGEEASFMVFCDGYTIRPLPSSQDHKRAGENDTGPNTGGMGAYSPAAILPENRFDEIIDLTIRPVIQHMEALGHPYQGVLYAGLMITADGPKVLEYNVRFGDPECQPLMSRLDSDLVEIMLACCQEKLGQVEVRIRPQHAACVVMASSGYPGQYVSGKKISGIDLAQEDRNVRVFQAGTRQENGQTISSGGRVLGVTALGDTLKEATKRAYLAVDKIHFDNAFFRRDIGQKGLVKEKNNND